jgi:branched-chain amino acid transport system ATP-binding protein
VLDEPSLGLSPLMVQTIFKILRQLHEGGLTIFLVEQNLNLALAHASRCYVLERGAMVLAGTSAELKADPRTRKAYLGL